METMENRTSVIMEGTCIEGNISSDGDVLVRGSVKGDIRCAGSLTIQGSMTGNTSAHSVTVDAARMEGDITAEGDAGIAEGSVIIGSISADGVSVSGAVKGNITSTGHVMLGSSAVIVGDIRSVSIHVENGAIIEGRCSQAKEGMDFGRLFAGSGSAVPGSGMADALSDDDGGPAPEDMEGSV